MSLIVSLENAGDFLCAKAVHTAIACTPQSITPSCWVEPPFTMLCSGKSFLHVCCVSLSNAVNHRNRQLNLNIL